MRKSWNPLTYWWECKMLHRHGKIVWQFLKNTELLYDPVILLLGIYWIENTCSYKNLYTTVHSTIVHSSRKPEIIQMSKWCVNLNKMGSIHTVEYYSVRKRNAALFYATTWMNPENMPDPCLKTRKQDRPKRQIFYDYTYMRSLEEANSHRQRAQQSLPVRQRLPKTRGRDR